MNRSDPKILLKRRKERYKSFLPNSLSRQGLAVKDMPMLFNDIKIIIK